MIELADLTLHHVDPNRLLFELIDPDNPDDLPAWFAEATTGGVKLESAGPDSVLVTMETKAQKESYLAVVSIIGVFTADDKTPSIRGKSHESIIEDGTPEELDSFARRAVDVLFPFLRAELFQLTSRFSGTPGIMLRPTPVLEKQAKRS